MKSKQPTILEQYIQLVANGTKPGCSVKISGAAHKYAQKYNLECLLCTPATGDRLIGKPKEYEIGRKENCITVINRIGLPNIPELDARIKKLLSWLNDYSVAQALVRLCCYPRIDPEFSIVEEDNRERPEIAVIQGVLYGYNLCCITYAVTTLYLRAPVVNWVEDLAYSATEGDINPHTRCEACTITLLKNLKS